MSPNQIIGVYAIAVGCVISLLFLIITVTYAERWIGSASEAKTINRVCSSDFTAEEIFWSKKVILDYCFPHDK